MGGSSSKSSRPSNETVGNTAATIGIILTAIALFVDQLTGLYLGGDDDDKVDGYCGFNTYRLDTDAGFTAMYYNYCCDDDSTCGDLLSLLDDDKQDDYCKTLSSGIAWLIFGIVAMLGALIAIGAVACQKGGLAKFGDIAACLSAVVAIAAWYIDNPICYDEDLVDDEYQRVGASIYCMIFAAVCFGLGGFCNCR